MNGTALDDKRWRRLKDVFTEAVELAPALRSPYLSALRLNDKTLYQELAELIEVDTAAGDFLDESISLESDSDALPASLVGETIGHYKIVREIERGGMGVVYEAARFDGAFEQRVAVKLVNRHFFSDELIRRFVKERQILARLEHPNIVRLLDGGLTDDKTPYYVMEFIEGTPVNVYCRENNLNTNEKLELFTQICSAVAYAHRQLIVHRDLKPSNILITKNGQAKLLDFGIAKILDAETDAQTQTNNAPLTPAYASPEQISGETITTASDVYSLGVILYELLTEKTPLAIYSVGQMEIGRGIREIEPVAPSRAISDLGFGIWDLGFKSFNLKSSVSQSGRKLFDESRQNTNPKSAIPNPKSLKGDLDNIVLKSLRKEKERRYLSVEQFADDIKSYLNGLPVKAHPQSFEYRASKFIKRNRLAVSLAAVAVLLITGGVVAAIWQSFEARRHQQIAEQNFNQVRKIANSFIFDYHDEIAKLEGSTSLREKLVVDAVNYLDAISSENTDNPELLKESAVAYQKIANVQGIPYDGNLGKSDEAIENYQKSINLLEKASSLAPSDLSLKDELVKSYRSFGMIKFRSGDKEQAAVILKKALAVGEDLDRSEENNLDRKISFLRLKIALADVTADRDNPAKLKLYKQVAADAQALYSSNPRNEDLLKATMTSMQRTGSALEVEGRYEESSGNAEKARDYYLQAVEYNYQMLNYSKTFAAISSDKNVNKQGLMVSHTNLASILNLVGENDKALENIEISENLIKEIKKGDINNREIKLVEPPILSIKQRILVNQGKLDAALKVAKNGLEIAEENRQSDPKNIETFSWTIQMCKEAAEILEKQNKETEARKYRQIFEDYKKQYREKYGNEWSPADSN